MENPQGSMDARELIQPLYKAKGWIMLSGILSIIGGVIQALSIVGLLIAWVPIWMGWLLYSIATKLTKAYDQGQTQDIKEVLSKMGLYFTILGIVTILAIVLMIVMLVLGIAMPGLLQSQIMPMMK